jgi:hypothetical protein
MPDDENITEKPAVAAAMTPMAQKSTALLFALFFLLFMIYTPYEHSADRAQGGLHTLFMLYHFIVNQTLGIVHEGGHGICYVLPCPEFVMVLNGTLFQWLFPGLIAWYYRRRGNIWGWYAGLFFLGFSMHYTAWYMSTAHEGAMVPAAKSFLGVDGYHDFHYLFSRLGVLRFDGAISKLTHAVAYLMMIYTIAAMSFTAFFSGGKKGVRSRRTRRNGRR